MPQVFADAVLPRHDVRVWELPGHGPHDDVRMMWHQSATNDAAQAWLRERVRNLFSHAAGERPAARQPGS